jgi:hypothetical protein
MQLFIVIIYYIDGNNEPRLIKRYIVDNIVRVSITPRRYIMLFIYKQYSNGNKKNK